MGELSGERIVGVGGMRRKAPECLVLFRCGACGGGEVLDAYKGPPTHTCKPNNEFMIPIRIAKGYGYDTDADSDAEDSGGSTRVVSDD